MQNKEDEADTLSCARLKALAATSQRIPSQKKSEDLHVTWIHILSEDVAEDTVSGKQAFGLAMRSDSQGWSPHSGGFPSTASLIAHTNQTNT